jgi:hypothetical protein
MIFPHREPVLKIQIEGVELVPKTGVVAHRMVVVSAELDIRVRAETAHPAPEQIPSSRAALKMRSRAELGEA